VFEWATIALLIDKHAVHAAVSPSRAVDLTAEAFQRHREGEWQMPPKVYVDAPPNGDFRAMPARGAGYTILKWVTSFPQNPARGLPVVAGALLLSDAGTGELLAILDCVVITSLRTGAAAAVSARALARADAGSVGIVGCGVNGAWAAGCLAADGHRSGVCADLRDEQAGALAAELGWLVGSRAEAVACDIVVTVTPGSRPVVAAGELKPGAHLAALGADAAGKAEVEAAELGRCRLFCDEWEQASGGGELSGPVQRGEVERTAVTELGAVLAGEAPGRETDSEITLFDSTGLAIQDLALAIAVYDAAASGTVPAMTIDLG
jgi:ornithine cyclodeaminase/alanine dehydrogenase-like protein (mu-crystallin family)